MTTTGADLTKSTLITGTMKGAEADKRIINVEIETKIIHIQTKIITVTNLKITTIIKETRKIATGKDQRSEPFTKPKFKCPKNLLLGRIPMFRRISQGSLSTSFGDKTHLSKDRMS